MIYIQLVPKCPYCAVGDAPHFGLNGSENPQPSHTVQYMTYQKEEPCTNPEWPNWAKQIRKLDRISDAGV